MSCEVSILADWEIEADEVPVVLFVATRSGVSPEAVVALRDSGQSWGALTARGVGVHCGECGEVSRQGNRQVDPVHTHPAERTIGLIQRFTRNIGHEGQGGR